MRKTSHSGPNVPLLDIHVACAFAIKIVHLKIGRFMKTNPQEGIKVQFYRGPAWKVPSHSPRTLKWKVTSKFETWKSQRANIYPYVTIIQTLYTWYYRHNSQYTRRVLDWALYQISQLQQWVDSHGWGHCRLRRRFPQLTIHLRMRVLNQLMIRYFEGLRGAFKTGAKTSKASQGLCSCSSQKSHKSDVRCWHL